MKKERRRYSGQEKVRILRRHLLDQVAVSDLCDEYGLNPNVFYQWQKTFFENGATAFDRQREIKQKNKEVFMPLVHRPGEAQVDFGYALTKQSHHLCAVVPENYPVPPKYSFFVICKDLGKIIYLHYEYNLQQLLRKRISERTFSSRLSDSIVCVAHLFSSPG